MVRGSWGWNRSLKLHRPDRLAGVAERVGGQRGADRSVSGERGPVKQRRARPPKRADSRGREW